jgi:hypothetical protein
MTVDPEAVRQTTKRAGQLLKVRRDLCPTSDNRSYVRFSLIFPRRITHNNICDPIPHPHGGEPGNVLR